jgi:diguanylate cyclase (GGDEF)-like protein/PAS domain S-box-containing protein
MEQSPLARMAPGRGATLLESIFDPIVGLRPVRDGEHIIDMVCVDANELACANLGHRLEDLLGARLLDLFPVIGALGLFDRYVAAFERGEQLVVDDVAVPGSLTGSLRSFDLRGVVVDDMLCVSWRDVNERAVAAQLLAASERRYRMLAENASDVVMEVDPTGCLLWASPSLSELYGWDMQSTSHLSLFDVVHPDDLDRALAVLPALVETGIDQRMDFRMVTRSGALHWMAVQARVLRHEAGDVSSVVIGAHDITREVETARALAESDEHFRQFVDHSRDIVFTADPDRRVTWVAPSITSVLGWKPEHLVGTPVIDLIHPADASMYQRERDAIFSSVRPTVPAAPLVLRIRDRAGHYRWVSGDSVPVFGADGALVSIVFTVRDVDSLVRATEELAEQRLRLKVTLDSLFEPHVMLEPLRDDLGRIVDLLCTDANRAACDYMASTSPSTELVNTRVRELLADRASSGIFERCLDVIVSGLPMVLDDHLYEWADDRGVRYFDIRGVKVGDALSVTWRDVTDRHRFEAELDDLAKHDPLTGLVNRAELPARIRQSIDEARAAGGGIGVALLDLDHFKDVNDMLGHEMGDRLLRSAASRIQNAVKQTDIVARLGGDEFVVVIAGVSQLQDAVECVERVLSSLQAPFSIDGHTMYATGSAGLALSAEVPRSDEVANLLREADTALYEAKETGRDRWALFSESLRADLAERVAIGTQLRTALARHELTVWYQPEVDLATGRVDAVEALLRWNHPDGDVRRAGSFMDVAEENGLMLEIGAHVISQVFSEVAELASACPDRHLTVRVNVSAAQLSGGDLLDQIDTAIAANGVDPTLICVEITETALLHDAIQVRRNLAMLRERGIRIAIDDFGIGYASLAYLRDFPVDLIKIDRSFLAMPDDDGRSRRLLQALVALADHLDIAVTAEGVESEEQAAFLRRVGCPTAQGFLFAPAVPLAEVRQLLRDGFGREDGGSNG